MTIVYVGSWWLTDSLATSLVPSAGAPPRAVSHVVKRQSYVNNYLFLLNIPRLSQYFEYIVKF